MGSNPVLHLLDKRGANAIGVTPLRAIKDIPHHIAINDVRIAVTLAAQSDGVELREWLDEGSIKSQWGKDSADPTLIASPLIADGWFVLYDGEYWHCFFLEVDLGTEVGRATNRDTKDWASKVRRYISYYESGQYEEAYGTDIMGILAVTTSEHRMKNLMKLTGEVAKDHKERFFFSTLSHAKSPLILTAPIWQIPQSPNPHSLLEGSHQL